MSAVVRSSMGVPLFNFAKFIQYLLLFCCYFVARCYKHQAEQQNQQMEEYAIERTLSAFEGANCARG